MDAQEWASPLSKELSGVSLQLALASYLKARQISRNQSQSHFVEDTDDIDATYFPYSMHEIDLSHTVQFASPLATAEPKISPVSSPSRERLPSNMEHSFFELLEKSMAHKHDASFQSSYEQEVLDMDMTALHDIDIQGMKALLITANRDKHRALRKIQTLQESVAELKAENCRLVEQQTSLYLIRQTAASWALPTRMLTLSQRFSQARVTRLFVRWKNVVSQGKKEASDARIRHCTLLVARRLIRKSHSVSLLKALRQWRAAVAQSDLALAIYARLAQSRRALCIKRGVLIHWREERQKQTLLVRLVGRIRRILLRHFFGTLKRQTHVKSVQCSGKHLALLSLSALHYRSQGSHSSVSAAFRKWFTAASAVRSLQRSVEARTHRLSRVLRASQTRSARRMFRQWVYVATTLHAKRLLGVRMLSTWCGGKHAALVRSAFRRWTSKLSSLKTKTSVLQRAGERCERRGVQHYFSRWRRISESTARAAALRRGDVRAQKTQFLNAVCFRLQRRGLLKVYLRLWRQQALCGGSLQTLSGSLAALQRHSETQRLCLEEEARLLKKAREKYTLALRSNRKLEQQYKANNFCKCVSRVFATALLRAFNSWRAASTAAAMTGRGRAEILSVRKGLTVSLMVSWLRLSTRGKLEHSFRLWWTLSRKLGAVETIARSTVQEKTKHLLFMWKSRFKKRLAMRSALRRLIGSTYRGRTFVAFLGWRQKTQRIRGATSGVLTLRKLRQRFLLKHALRLWSRAIHDGRFAAELSARTQSDSSLRMSKLTVLLGRWRQYALHIKLRKASVRHLMVWRHFTRQQQAFGVWRVRTQRDRVHSTWANLLRRMSRGFSHKSLRAALSRWKSINWHQTAQRSAHLSARLSNTLTSIQSLTSHQDNLELHNHQVLTQSIVYETRNRKQHTQILRLFTYNRAHNITALVLRQWKTFHLSRRDAKQTVVKYTQRSLFHARLCSLSHGFHSWLKHVRSKQSTNEWHLLLKKREMLYSTRFHLTQWKHFTSQRTLLAKSFRAHMFHVHKFASVRSVYYAFFKWKAHHIVEHNYWISVTSRMFNRWAQVTQAAKLKRAQIAHTVDLLTSRRLFAVFHKWRALHRQHCRMRLVCSRILRISQGLTSSEETKLLKKGWDRWRRVAESWNKTAATLRTMVRCSQRMLKSGLLRWKRVVAFKNTQATALKGVLTRLTSGEQRGRLYHLFYSWKLTASSLRRDEKHYRVLGDIVASNRDTHAQRRALRAWQRVAQERPLHLRLTGLQVTERLTSAQACIAQLHSALIHHLSPEAALQAAVEGLQSVLPTYTVSVYYRLVSVDESPLMGLPSLARGDTLWGLSSASEQQTFQATPLQATPLGRLGSSLRLTASNLPRSASTRGLTSAGSFRNFSPAAKLSRLDSSSSLVHTFSLSDLKPTTPSLARGRSSLNIDTAAAAAAATPSLHRQMSGISTFESVGTEDFYLGKFTDQLASSDTRHLEVQVGAGLVGECAASGRVRLVTVQCMNAASLTLDTLTSEVALPLVGSDGSVVGVIHLVSRGSGAGVTPVVASGAPTATPMTRLASYSSLFGSAAKKSSAAAFGTDSDSPSHASSVHVVLKACIDMRLDEPSALGLLSLYQPVSSVLSQYFYRDQQQLSTGDVVTSLLNHSNRPEIEAALEELSALVGVGTAEYLQAVIEVSRGQHRESSDTQAEVSKLHETIQKLKQSRNKHISLAKELSASLEACKQRVAEEQTEREALAVQLKKSEERLGKFSKRHSEIQLMNQEVRAMAAQTLK